MPELAEPAPFDVEGPERLDLGGFGAVLFATGFRPDYVYFVGVHFLRKRKSSLLIGVGEDAAIVARRIAARAHA